MTVSPGGAKVYDRLADELVGLGVHDFFGLMGGDTAPLTTVLQQNGLHYLSSRHEAAAVAMADGFAWATGEPGICLVTRGPGFTNGITAARGAVRGGRPVVIITSAKSTRSADGYDVKSVDQPALAAAVGLEYFNPASADTVAASLHAAIASALSGRPAVMAVPEDVLNGPAASGAAARRHEEISRAPRTAATKEPSHHEIAEIAQLLAVSSRPLLLAGRGASSPGAKAALESLAQCTGALLGTSLFAKDLFRGHPLNLGIVGGFGIDAAKALLAQVDCVVAFGTSLSPYLTAHGALFRAIPVVQIDADPAAVGQQLPVRLGVVADAELTARMLLQAVPARSKTDMPFHREEVIASIGAAPYTDAGGAADGGLDPRALTAVLDQLLPEDRVVVVDGGRFNRAPARYLHVGGPDAFRFTTAEFFEVGIGIGTALGAAVGRPDRPTVLFIGDGGLLMTLGELDTVVRSGVPLVVVVMNDRAYGAERNHLERAGLPPDYANFPITDFAAVAGALGIEAAVIRTIDEVRAYASRLSGRSTPLLLDCRIRQDLTVPTLSWRS